MQSGSDRYQELLAATVSLLGLHRSNQRGLLGVYRQQKAVSWYLFITDTGFQIYSYFVEGINSYGQRIGYTKYKYLITHVEEEGIYPIYTTARQCTKHFIQGIMNLNSPQELRNQSELLSMVFNLLLNILNFPFLMTVGEYYSDNIVENFSPVVLPDSYPDEFFDSEFLQSLKQMVVFEPMWNSNPNLSREDKQKLAEVSLLAAKILSKFPAVKRNSTHCETVVSNCTGVLIESFKAISEISLQKFQTGRQTCNNRECRTVVG